VNVPSKKSLKLAEELLDHVSYGLTRSDVITEWAEMVDAANADLVESVNRLLKSAERNQGIADPIYITQLRNSLQEHQPKCSLPDALADFFQQSSTKTVSSI